MTPIGVVFWTRRLSALSVPISCGTSAQEFRNAKNLVPMVRYAPFMDIGLRVEWDRFYHPRRFLKSAILAAVSSGV